jgi:hypothetical protein
MSVFNRRNAILGWAAWTITKQVAKHKARRATSVDGGTVRRIAVPAAVAAAAATVVGALLFWKRRGRPDELDELTPE